MPSFSIVTPVLNQAHFIESCIESVYSQDADVEHIIIDGGSTDGTVEIIQKHQNKLKYWISEKDKGQSDAINKGLQHCEGTFFNWLNADDTLASNSLNTIKTSIESNTSAIVGTCNHINQNGEFLNSGSAQIRETLEETLGNYRMGQPAVFYRTALVKQLGGLNTNLHLCLDMDLWFRFLLKFGQTEIIQLKQHLANFLVHDNSKSSTQPEEMKREKYGIYKALLVETDIPNILDSFLAQFEIPKGVTFELPKDFESRKLVANFCWHLLIATYENKNLPECRQYLNVLKEGNRLSNSEILKWEARLASLLIRS